MSRARPYIPLGCDQQGRMTPTALLRYEDAIGTCNTCPGELEPAEALQRDPVRLPPPVPWRQLGAGLLVVLLAVAGAHVASVVWPSSQQVASR